MERRTFLLGLAALPVLSFALPNQNTCPICGGRLVMIGSLQNTESKPSRNLDVWNGSYHGDLWPFYSAQSSICSRCFAAFRESDATWVRSSEISNSFFVPLSNSIAYFPVPAKSSITSRIVYSQIFMGAAADRGLAESVSFWFRDSTQALAAMRRYSSGNNVSLNATTAPSQPGETYIVASAPNNSFKPKPLRGSA